MRTHRIATSRTSRTTRNATRTAAVLVSAGVVLGLSACGSDGTTVFERKGNSTQSGVVQLQPGNYALDLSCTDKRSSRKVNGKKQKTGSTPTVQISTIINGQQVETDASCTGSDDQTFSLSAPTSLDVRVTLNGSATYTAKVLQK